MIKQPATNAALAPVSANSQAVDEQASPVLKSEHGLKKVPPLCIDLLMVLLTQFISRKQVDDAGYLVIAGINGHETVSVRQRGSQNTDCPFEDLDGREARYQVVEQELIQTVSSQANVGCNCLTVFSRRIAL